MRNWDYNYSFKDSIFKSNEDYVSSSSHSIQKRTDRNVFYIKVSLIKQLTRLEFKISNTQNLFVKVIARSVCLQDLYI